MNLEARLLGVLFIFILFCWNFTVFYTVIIIIVMMLKLKSNMMNKHSLDFGDRKPHEERICLPERKINHYIRYRKRGRFGDSCCLTLESKYDNDDNSYQYSHDGQFLSCVKKYNEDRKRGYSGIDSLKSSIVFKLDEVRTMRKIKSTEFLFTTSPVVDLFPLNDPFRFVSNSRLSTDIQVNHLTVSSHPREIHGIPWNYYNNEYYRLISFVSYPKKDSVSTIRLASKGFAYPGDGMDQEIICYFCTARMEGKEEIEIDDTHKRTGMDCPMVQGSKCNNISMENHYPQNADALFSKFLEFRQLNQGDAFVLSPQSAIGASPHDTTAKSSQPSDESAASAIVTNSTDLEEADSVVQNSNSGDIIESSHVMDPSSSREFPDRTDASSARVSVGNTSATNTNTVNAPASQSNERPGNSNTQESSPQPNEPQQGNAQQVNPQQQPNDELQSTDNSNSNERSGEATNYEKLGIITARPKRPEYAVFATRMASFNEWPKQHHMKPKDLANAGYFYTGYSDCARCFYCGGGLRNWEQDDDVWVEHARWFPKCAFLLQELGNEFIQTVMTMSKEKDDVNIKYDEVIKRMQDSNGATSPLTYKDKGIERDPAVLTVVDNGFAKDEICKLALGVRKSGELLSSEKLYESAKAKDLNVTNNDNLGSDSVSIRKGGNVQRDKETIETLRNDNGELRQQTICKICMDMDVAVVFLPCGHFVSCTECSCALTACPLCRVGIKGIVRAYMG